MVQCRVLYEFRVQIAFLEGYEHKVIGATSTGEEIQGVGEMLPFGAGGLFPKL